MVLKMEKNLNVYCSNFIVEIWVLWLECLWYIRLGFWGILVWELFGLYEYNYVIIWELNFFLFLLYILFY